MALHKCHVPVNIAKRTVTMIKICIISFLLLFFFSKYLQKTAFPKGRVLPDRLYNDVVLSKSCESP